MIKTENIVELLVKKKYIAVNMVYADIDFVNCFTVTNEDLRKSPYTWNYKEYIA